MMESPRSALMAVHLVPLEDILQPVGNANIAPRELSETPNQHVSSARQVRMLNTQAQVPAPHAIQAPTSLTQERLPTFGVHRVRPRLLEPRRASTAPQAPTEVLMAYAPTARLDKAQSQDPLQTPNA